MLDLLFYAAIYAIAAYGFHYIFTAFLFSASVVNAVYEKDMLDQWLICFRGRQVASILWFIFVPILLYYLLHDKITSR